MALVTASILNAILGLLLVCAYYVVLWFRSGVYDREPIVTLYSPPRDLSAAMLRFIWKERFDDRTFWAGVLSLVSKGLATLEDEGGQSFVRPTDALYERPHLSGEESALVKALFKNRSRRRVSLNVTDEKATVAISQASAYLHHAAVGRWFRSNYHYLLVGAGLSLAAVCLTAGPKSPEQWGGLFLGLAAMAPGGYYGFFVLLRIVDFVRVVRKHIGVAVIGRAAVLIGLLVPSVAAFVLGGVVLGVNFGFPVLILTASLVAVNTASLLWLRFPTAKGRKLLNEIQGFRDFLLSVERLPEDRPDAPSDRVGLYEKYLPYAVALEVEQSWCDQFVALRSAFHEKEFMPGVRPFYLGMWDGNPVEIVYKPTSGSRSY